MREIKKDRGGRFGTTSCHRRPFPRLRGTANKGKPLRFRAVALTRIKGGGGGGGGRGEGERAPPGAGPSQKKKKTFHKKT